MSTNEEQAARGGALSQEFAFAEIDEIIAGGGASSAAAADIDSLFDAVLSEREVATILADKEAGAGLFTDAAEVFIGRALKKSALEYDDWKRLEAIFEDGRGRARAEADRLARHCMPLVARFGQYHAVSTAAEHFFAAADISAPAVTGIVAGERDLWDTKRLRPLAEMLARRAAALAGEGARGSCARHAVAALEELFADARVGESCATARAKGDDGSEGDDAKKEARDTALKFHLLVVLDRLYPVVSLPLLDLAVASAFENWHAPASAYAALADVYTDERAERFFDLENVVVDSALARNPNLAEPLAWRIFERHAAESPYRAGHMLAHRPEIVAHVERARLGAAACGALARAGAKRDGDGVTLTEGLVEVAFGECAANPSDDYSAAAGVIYERLGEEAGGALVRLKKDRITRAVLEEWKQHRRAGAVLDALLAYPRQETRILLLGTPGDSRWAAFKQFDLVKAGADVRELYRHVVLPRFSTDRASEVREIAMGMLMRLAEDAEGKQLALSNASPSDITEFARTADAITGEQFQTILERAVGLSKAGDYHHARDILKTLAARDDLTFAQYRRLAGYGKDEITAVVVASVRADGEGVKEFLLAQRGAGVQTCAALAALDLWDVYERAFYAGHKEESVRASFAKRNANLTNGEVADLLCDRSDKVRKALLDNARWLTYAGQLRNLVDAARRHS
jgi:hypothetical protein